MGNRAGLTVGSKTILKRVGIFIPASEYILKTIYLNCEERCEDMIDHRINTIKQL